MPSLKPGTLKRLMPLLSSESSSQEVGKSKPRTQRAQVRGGICRDYRVSYRHLRQPNGTADAAAIREDQQPTRRRCRSACSGAGRSLPFRLGIPDSRTSRASAQRGKRWLLNTIKQQVKKDSVGSCNKKFLPRDAAPLGFLRAAGDGLQSWRPEEIQTASRFV